MRYQLLAIFLLFCFGCNKPASEAKPSDQGSSPTNVASPEPESIVLLVGIRGEETKLPNPDAALIEEKLRSLDWTIPHNRVWLNRKQGKDIDNMFIESRDNQLYAMHLASTTAAADQSKSFESLDTALQILISHLNEDDKYLSIVEWEHNSFLPKSGTLTTQP